MDQEPSHSFSGELIIRHVTPILPTIFSLPDYIAANAESIHIGDVRLAWNHDNRAYPKYIQSSPWKDPICTTIGRDQDIAGGSACVNVFPLFKLG